MPTILTPVALGAGGVNTNVAAGSPFEFPGRANIQIAAVSDQADVLMNISFGSRIVAQDITVPLEPAAGQGPFINQQMFVDEPILNNERITVAMTGGAAASVSRVLVNITPL